MTASTHAQLRRPDLLYRYPPAPPRVVADGCGGFGSSVVKWIEESAANFSAKGERFGSAYEAKSAVERQVGPKLHEAWRELQRQQGNVGNRPQFYTPNVVVPGANFLYGMRNLDDQMFRSCFPKLAKLMANTETRVAAEQRAEAERQAADAERLRQEAAAREAAQRTAAEEAAKRREAQAREDATPHGQVRRAYSLYILLRWCHETREGYLVNGLPH